MVVIDTNIIIDHLRQRGRGKSILEKLATDHPKGDLAISVLSIQELYEGQSMATEMEEEKLLSTIAGLNVLPYTFEIAQIAGTIARNNARLMEFVDAGIAATTVARGAVLLTLNKKDFAKIPSLELL